jgi:hypothetical protein
MTLDQQMIYLEADGQTGDPDTITFNTAREYEAWLATRTMTEKKK